MCDLLFAREVGLILTAGGFGHRLVHSSGREGEPWDAPRFLFVRWLCSRVKYILGRELWATLSPVCQLRCLEYLGRVHDGVTRSGARSVYLLHVIDTGTVYCQNSWRRAWWWWWWWWWHAVPVSHCRSRYTLLYFLFPYSRANHPPPTITIGSSNHGDMCDEVANQSVTTVAFGLGKRGRWSWGREGKGWCGV